MSHLVGIDVSRWQDVINWAAVPHPIAIIKMSGGDAGLYIDSKANLNYYGAKAAGKAVGMYHFAGGGDAYGEADYFVNACSPLEENDVLVLDWEVSHPDPVGWCYAFVNRVHEKTGIWPLIYMNGSTLNSYNWMPVTQNCGVWVAWYDRDPEGNLPVQYPYVMHQYTSTGSVPGVSGNVDMNAWFGTIEQFKKYGWHGNTPAPLPVPVPVPTPQPIPTPVPVPQPVPTPVPTPTPEPTPTPTIPVDPTNPPDSPVEVLPAERPYNIQAIAIRVFSTFYQAAAAVLLAGLTGVVDATTLKVLVVASFAAGVSAVKNIIVKPQEKK